jgi:sensor histidine kinase YesM
MLKTKRIILLLYLFIWALVFLGPYLRNMDDMGAHISGRMIGDWINLSLLFILFLINLYFLVPKLLFNHKKSQYAIIVIITILLVTAMDILIHYVLMSPDPGPMGLHPGGPPPDPSFAPGSVMGSIFNNLITAILIIGTSTAMELVFKWGEEEKRRKDIEKEQLKTNLALLRHQVSPHFFMNTLNNIHALIEINSEKAQDAVVRLSTLMRYLLYDSAQNTIELKKEIEFIHSFISLMQLRHSEEVEVKILIPEQIPEVKIPPMLFISLLENAFKHGVCYPLKSYIYFELQVDENSLHCTIKNSKHTTATQYEGEYSGMGIENITDSLKLLYGDAFLLNILDKESEFEVNLKIPL